MKTRVPIARNSNVGVQEIDNEVLIYDFATNKAFCLNETAALIWQNCDGKNSLADVARLVGDELKSPVDEGLVWLALEQLKSDDLVTHELPPPAPLAGMGRREVIKKVGLASLIALPLISSVIAPMAANAQSVACESPGFTTQTGCTSPGACLCGPGAPDPQCCTTMTFLVGPSPTGFCICF